MDDAISILVEAGQAGKRLDLFVHERLPQYSRSFVQRLITQGLLEVNQQVAAKTGYIVKPGDVITLTFPVTPVFDQVKLVGDLGVKLVHEHPDFLIVNKPAGLVVHAPDERYEGVALVDWLLQHYGEVAQVGAVGRPGIVHRLDQHTSGLMVIPRHNVAHAYFGELFRDHLIRKTYLAVAVGHPPAAGLIDYAIVRHPVHRHKMTHVLPRVASQSWARQARFAQTSYRVLKYFERFAVVEAKPVTGRTHQIRVHFAAIGHSLLGDTTYGSQSDLISRQALHAYRLEFTYGGKFFSFTQSPPSDFETLYAHTDFKLTT